VEPPHSYLQETSSSVVHHQDYLNANADQALCGVTLTNSVPLDPAVGPVAVCADCEVRLVAYHLKWWRERAEAATAELDELRIAYRALVEASGEPSEASAESRMEIAEEPQPGPTADQAEPTQTPLLDQARKELVELCRRFDDAVPYWRLKNSMDAFSDRLNADERVLLAQEIGAGGSLIRWCTTEIEKLGWHVSNSPVTGDADDMADAWTHDLYQTPKKTKWRLGRARSHDAS
jgi:hypothetical protein